MSDHGLTLSTGQVVPAVAFGTWKLDNRTAAPAVAAAIADGYRLIDTATRYHNEIGVGRGLRESGLPREDVMVTSKLRGGDQGAEQTTRAVHASMTALDVDYLDLYLVHWPLPRLDRYVESWRELIELRDQGLIRGLGVSNFTADQIDRLVTETGVAPVLNQVELHLGWRQDELLAQMAERGIPVQAWGAIGRGKGLLDDERLTTVAARHQVSPAQVALRWVWERGAGSVAKSGDQTRRRQNLDIHGFSLTEDDHALLASFPQERIGKDPLVNEEY